MILRVATKRKLDGDLSTLWLNDFTLSMEVDQTRNSLLLSLSPLAPRTYGVVVSLRGRAIEAGAKLQQIFPSRIGIILH